MDYKSQEWFTGDHFERYTRSMAAKKIDLGGTGETVRENVKRLRGGMQFKELSERLSAIGRPIPPLGLRRIEAGERRVDVDDLVALSVVFDVSPLALLFPSNAAVELSSPMTGVTDREVSHYAQWLWGMGTHPLWTPWDMNDAREAAAAFRERAIASMTGKSEFSRDKFEADPGNPELKYLASILGIEAPPEPEAIHGND